MHKAKLVELRCTMSSSAATVQVYRQMRTLAHTYECTMDHEDGLSWTVVVASDACPTRLSRALRKARHLEMVLHIRFPDDFPASPPFVRVVRPTFERMTGHITSGGAICAEVLSSSQSAEGWISTISMGSLIPNLLVVIDDGTPEVVKGKGRYWESDAREAHRRLVARYRWM